MYKNYILFVLTITLIFDAQAQITFQDQATALGVGVVTGDSAWGNGVTFFDYNGDGWDDLTLNTKASSTLRFYKNVNGTFVQEFLISPSIIYQTKQVNWVDFDNDGDKDLFVTSDTNGNRLYKNNGSMAFQNITATAGLPTTNMYTYGASWGDYNNDGFLDVYVSNRDENTFTTPNYLYKNNGDGTFTDVSNSVGLNTTAHSSFCSAFFDFNNDGWQDLFVANDRYTYENYLYKNNGDGTFTDVGASSGVGVFMDAMSATIDDFNHDGWFDIYVTNTTSGNKFFMNNGDETFTDISASAGTTFNGIAWGSVFFDADNDQDLDLYVSGRLDGVNPNLIPYAFYENNNDGTFYQPNPTGLEIDNRSSYSNAIGDFNNDGLFDIVVSNNDNTKIFLWENTSAVGNNWLKLKLTGVQSNRDGIGSVIEIGINGSKQYRYTLCGEGYLSQNSNSEIFGLGTNTSVDYVKITWLSGTVDYFYNVSANQIMSVIEGAGTLSIGQEVSRATRVYPNPVKDVLNINTLKVLTSASIYDMNGQLINTIKLDDFKSKINVSMLTPGIYILKIATEESISSHKFIKQ